ncbi:TolC family protein [Clostridium sp. WILCCON 0269]|uniref:TolC family protein n=1 Tax=Candidatus Clostridium eludens TaxID=3381663 RepID=A0ABW8SEX6_9CLOT
MNKKKLAAFLISGLMMLSASNVIASQDDAANTLDIEKAAIETINNSQSVKTYDEKTKNANKQYTDAQAAAQSAVSSGAGNLIQVIILNPIEAENTFKQFTTNKGVNTNSVRLQAYSKYIELLKANYAVNIQKQLNDNLEQDNKNTQLQLANGLMSKNDARLTEIKYLQSTYQLNSLQNSLDSAYMAVNLAMGEDIAKRYTTLIDKDIVPAKDNRTLDNYIKGALLNRGEVVNAQNTLDAKKKELYYEQYDRYSDYEFYLQKTQYDIDNSQNKLDESKINIQLEISKGYRTLEGYMKAIESQQAYYDLAEANYESAKTQYSNSMITLNQFENAEIKKAQAQINLKNAQLDAWLQQTKMNYASDIGPSLN